MGKKKKCEECEIFTIAGLHKEKRNRDGTGRRKSKAGVK